MDSRTVYALSCICLAATAWLVGVAVHSYPLELRRDGYRWSWAVGLLAAGMGLVAVRGQVPDPLSILGHQASVVLGVSGIFDVLQRFQRVRLRQRWVYLPLPLALVSASYFYFVAPNYALRVAVFSSICAAQLAVCASVMMRGRGPAPRTARLVAVGFAACSALLLTRTVDSLRLAPTSSPQVVFRNAPLEQGVVVGLFVGFFALSFSFVILCNERLSRELVVQATRDALTGCLNRGTIEELAEREAARARRHDLPLAVALVDLDHLKAINDRHGHAAGDTVLRRIAQAMARALRSEDLVGRYGGDEFLLLMPETAAERARIACERVRAAVHAEVVEHDGVRLPATVSVGVASAHGVAADLTALVAAADAALYDVKRAAGDAVRVGVAPGAAKASAVPAS